MKHDAPPDDDSLLPVFAGVGIAALIALPLLALGRWPESHEGTRYLHLTLHFFEAWSAGILYPRWLPDLAGGYGYPTFVFYQPLFFAVAGVWYAVVGNIVLAGQLAVSSFLVGGAAGAGLLLREWCSARLAAILTCLWMLSPYLFVNLWVRGDLSELAATMILPWIALASWRQVRAQQEGRAGYGATAATGLLLALLVLAHPIIAMFGWLTFFCLRLWVAVRRPATTGSSSPLATAERRAHLHHLAVAMLIGGGLSISYWGPVLQMRELVRLSAAFGSDYAAAHHTVPWWQLFDRHWGFGTSTADDDTRMSLQLGLAQVLLAMGGLWFGARAPGPFARGLRVAAVATAVWILAISDLAAPLWNLPPLSFAQFPWRALSVVGLLLVVCGAGWQRQGGRATIAAPLLLFCLAFIWQPTMFQLPPVTPGMPDDRAATLVRVQAERKVALQIPLVYASEDEFLPLTSKQPPNVGRADAPLVEVLSGDALVEPAPNSSSHRLRGRVRQPTGDEPVSLLVRQLFFPGFVVRLGEHALSDEVLQSALRPDGTMVIELDVALATTPDSGREWTYDIAYGGPPYGPLRVLVTLLALALMGWCLFRHLQERRELLRG